MTPSKNSAPELSPEATASLENIGQADIVVGIPSFNNADTIGHVARAVQVGLLKYFPTMKSVVINSDGGSSDGTADVVRGIALGDLERLFVHYANTPISRIVTPYRGIPGKGSAFRTVFHLADRLEARACCVVDSDLRSITPEWIEALVSPVLYDDFDYVCPMYLRHKYDGTITNSIIYPLTRALYGVNLRQPIGGDFGFSGRLARTYLGKDVWDTDVARFGIDIWMTTTAVAEEYKSCQAFLGAKIHNPKDPGSDLAGMLCEVVGAVFDLMQAYEHVWAEDRPDQQVPLFGFPHEVGLDPLRVNLERMVDNFQQGLRDLAPLWTQVLHEETWAGLQALAGQTEESITFPDRLWARIVYDFAATDKQKRFNREQMLRSLTPLYLGRVASFVRVNADASAQQVEERLDALCQVYREELPYLRERWGVARRPQEVSS
jgi:hypothetical protein